MDRNVFGLQSLRLVYCDALKENVFALLFDSCGNSCMRLVGTWIYFSVHGQKCLKFVFEITTRVEMCQAAM